MSKSLRTMEFTADRTGFTRQTQISSTKQLCGSRPGKSSPLTFTGVSGDAFSAPHRRFYQSAAHFLADPTSRGTNVLF